MNTVKIENNKSAESQNIITVVSNKGGAGKTSIAIAAGFYFSNCRNQTTLLLELDSSPGDFGSLFDIGKEKSLDFVVRFPENISNYSKKILKNLYAIRGAANPFLSEKIEIERFNIFLDFLMSKYSNIVIDTQSVMDAKIIQAMKYSSKILLLSEYSLESVSRNLNLYVSLVNRYGINREKISLIINKKRLFDYMKVWSFSDFSEFPIEGFISFDRKFNKTFYMSNFDRLRSTKLFKQLEKIMKNIQV
jgi:MinD-like ATPase involved in chromosome partitioning or flagellar assembly